MGSGLGESGAKGLCVQIGRAVPFQVFWLPFRELGSVGGRGKGEGGVGGRVGGGGRRGGGRCSSIPVTETDSLT